MNRVVAQQELERQNFRVRGNAYFSLFFFDFHRTNSARFRRIFHSFDPVGFAIFAIHPHDHVSCRRQARDPLGFPTTGRDGGLPAGWVSGAKGAGQAPSNRCTPPGRRKASIASATLRIMMSNGTQRMNTTTSLSLTEASSATGKVSRAYRVHSIARSQSRSLIRVHRCRLTPHRPECWSSVGSQWPRP
jgi:hypothetical protein